MIPSAPLAELWLPHLRRWQVEALAAWESADFRGTFEVATGGGKTTFALACVTRFREVVPDVKCLVIVPSVALLDQWFVAAQEDLGLAEESIRVLSTRNLTPDRFFNLAVLNSARGLPHVDLGSSPILQIVDECHRAGSEMNRRALLPNSAASLGLSATPQRDFDAGFEQYVQPALGPVVYKYSLAEAIEDGVLAGVRLTYVHVPLTTREQADYQKLSGRIARAFQVNAEPSHVEALLRKRARLYNNAAFRLPTLIRLFEDHRARRSMVFVESIAAAQEAQKLLQAQGHSVVTYHSGMGGHLRRSNLRSFRRGLFDILIACRALDEGFNVPEAEMAVIVAGTAAKRQRVQRVGRVLRAMEGKDHAEVITFYSTPVEEQRLLAESGEFPEANIRWVAAHVGV